MQYDRCFALDQGVGRIKDTSPDKRSSLMVFDGDKDCVWLMDTATRILFDELKRYYEPQMDTLKLFGLRLPSPLKLSLREVEGMVTVTADGRSIWFPRSEFVDSELFWKHYIPKLTGEVE